MIDVVGYLAGLGALLMWLPQGWRVVHHRHDARTLSGISVGAYSTGMLFNALLFVYGVGTHGTPVIAAACVNFLMSSVIVTLVARSRTRV